MKTFILFSLLLLNCLAFSTEWTRNNILKFSIYKISNLDFLSDYENIILTNGVIKPTASYGWFYTKPFEVKEGLVVDRAFVNLKTGGSQLPDRNEKGVRVRILDYNTDEIIGERVIFSSGVINLKDTFRKSLYFSLEFFDTNVELLSFGLKGKTSELLNSKELIIQPALLFYKEETLLIKFKLGKPSFVDVLIFNRNILVDTIMRENFLKNGEVVIKYDMSKNKEKFLSTGTHWVYIKAKTLDENSEEITKSFYFVKE
ncbi:MAG: hypothetical protein ACP5QT_05000 [Brevinematia bacterium]